MFNKHIYNCIKFKCNDRFRNDSNEAGFENVDPTLRTARVQLNHHVFGFVPTNDNNQALCIPAALREFLEFAMTILS